MNTSSGFSKRSYRTEVLEYSAGVGYRGAVWKIIFPCLVVLATGLSYIWLRSSTENLHRKNMAMREQSSQQSRQLSNLRVDQESYTSRSEILKRITEFQLDLRPPMVGQTRRITLRRQPVQEEARDHSLIARSGNW